MRSHLFCIATFAPRYRARCFSITSSMRSHLFCIATFAALTTSAVSAADLTGTLKGVIVDRTTQQPLPGANIVVLDAQAGSIAGEDGRFIVPGVPLGVHRLQVSMIGYQTAIRPDIVVRANRITAVEVELEEQPLGMEETVVTADYFSQVEEEAVSTVNFNYEEIRRYLELIVDAIGTGAVPRYSDLQGKVTRDLSDDHQLSFLGLAGFDEINFEPGDADADDDFTDFASDQYVAGANWRWLWSTGGYANTSLSFTLADYAVDAKRFSATWQSAVAQPSVCIAWLESYSKINPLFPQYCMCASDYIVVLLGVVGPRMDGLADGFPLPVVG